MATPTHISSFSEYSCLQIGRGRVSLASPSSGTWTDELAVYMPLMLPFPFEVRRVFWGNGSTVTSSNADFGVYTDTGSKIFSVGATALSGTTALQYATPASTIVLPAGFYYMAYWCDNTTNRTILSTTLATNEGRLVGLRQEAAGASGLPATATMAQWASALLPLCGITRTASGY